jgi:drug/metabolite transporter (DMT)-like permease
MRIDLFAAVYGAALWLAMSLVTGRAEAWDNMLYWEFGLPALLLGAIVCGWIVPIRSWRWGAWMSGGQAVMGIVLGLIYNLSLNMLPLGIVLFVILSLPLMLASHGGGAARVILDKRNLHLGGFDATGQPREQKPGPQRHEPQEHQQ